PCALEKGKPLKIADLPLGIKGSDEIGSGSRVGVGAEWESTRSPTLLPLRLMFVSQTPTTISDSSLRLVLTSHFCCALRPARSLPTPRRRGSRRPRADRRRPELRGASWHCRC